MTNAGEDAYGAFIEVDMNGLGFRVRAPENIRTPRGPSDGETVYDNVTQRKIR